MKNILFDLFSKKIVKICKKLYLKGLIAGADGNVSIKNKNKIIITPSGFHKGLVSFKEMTFTDLSGKIIAGRNKPSSEISFHLAIYKKDKKCNAIIHTHPPFVMALYTAGLKIEPYFMAESKILFEDKIIEIPFIMPGSKELAEEISANANNGDIFILQNHGIVVKADTLENAFMLTEALEHNARIKILTLLCAEKKGIENIISCFP